MKKIFFLAVLIAMALLSACTPIQPNNPARIATDFSATAVVKTNEIIECTISHTAQGVSTMSITKPERIKDLKFTWKSGEYTIEWGELACKSEYPYFPDESFPNQIINVLDSISDIEALKLDNTNDEVNLFIGETENSDFTVTVDNKTDLIKQIKIDNGKINVEFSDVKEFL
ncbi:hypothetical protein AGMMS50284_5440 [Clostridia bacterium]|nr:hypothetical protein AGMMS50284_5440 [Clostridia bacterium]